MRRLSWTRRMVKWVGLAGVVLIATVYAKSLWTIVPLLGGPIVWLEAQWGVVDIEILHDASAVDRVGSIESPDSRLGLALPQHGATYTVPANKRVGTQLRIPLWIPFMILAIPTAIAWWRDRRVPVGHCQHCGYDLTGNVSGRCPECGTAIEGTTG